MKYLKYNEEFDESLFSLTEEEVMDRLYHLVKEYNIPRYDSKQKTKKVFLGQIEVIFEVYFNAEYWNFFPYARVYQEFTDRDGKKIEKIYSNPNLDGNKRTDGRYYYRGSERKGCVTDTRGQGKESEIKLAVERAKDVCDKMREYVESGDMNTIGDFYRTFDMVCEENKFLN